MDDTGDDDDWALAVASGWVESMVCLTLACLIYIKTCNVCNGSTSCN